MPQVSFPYQVAADGFDLDVGNYPKTSSFDCTELARWWLRASGESVFGLR